MGELLLVASASLLLGMRHATDADHVLAIATIVSKERSLRGAARIGAIWGMGHGVTIALVGGSVMAFRLTLSPRIELSLEFAVALMLILLGTLTLLQRKIAPQPVTAMRPFVVGIVHGLAGSAAASVLVLSTIADPLLGVVYLLVFGLGTLIGMGMMTSAIAVPSLITRDRVHTPHWIRGAAGALTLAFGCYLAFRIGVVDGLLTSAALSPMHD